MTNNLKIARSRASNGRSTCQTPQVDAQLISSPHVFAIEATNNCRVIRASASETSRSWSFMFILIVVDSSEWLLRDWVYLGVKTCDIFSLFS